MNLRESLKALHAAIPGGRVSEATVDMLFSRGYSTAYAILLGFHLDDSDQANAQCQTTVLNYLQSVGMSPLIAAVRGTRTAQTPFGFQGHNGFQYPVMFIPSPSWAVVAAAVRLSGGTDYASWDGSLLRITKYLDDGFDAGEDRTLCQHNGSMVELLEAAFVDLLDADQITEIEFMPDDSMLGVWFETLKRRLD